MVRTNQDDDNHGLWVPYALAVKCDANVRATRRADFETAAGIATREAIDELRRELATQIGLVPSPCCGTYAEEMTARSAASRQASAVRFGFECLAFAEILVAFALAHNWLRTNELLGAFRPLKKIAKIPVPFLWSAGLASALLRIGAQLGARWWARKGDENQQPLAERLARASQLAYKPPGAKSDASKVRRNAEVEIETSIVNDRRRGAAGKSLVVFGGFETLIALAMIVAAAHGARASVWMAFAVLATLVTALTVVSAFVYSRHRSAMLADLADSIALVQPTEVGLDDIPYGTP